MRTYILFVTVALLGACAGPPKLNEELLSKLQTLDPKQYVGYCSVSNGEKTARPDKTCGLVYYTLGGPRGLRLQIDDSEFEAGVRIIGTDVTRHEANNDNVVKTLMNLALRVHELRQDSDKLKLKDYIVKIAKNGHFSEPMAHSFSSQSRTGLGVDVLKNYPVYAESVWRSWFTVQAVIFAYPFIVNELSEEEKASIKRWGYTTIQNNESKKTIRWADRDSDRAAGQAVTEIMWALMFADAKLLERGVGLFQAIVDDLSPAGFQYSFMPHKGQQLRYHHHILGQLVLPAVYLERNGIEAFTLKGKRGGTLKNSLEWFLVNTFDQDARTDIEKKQDTWYICVGCMDYFDFVAAHGVFDEQPMDKRFPWVFRPRQ